MTKTSFAFPVSPAQVRKLQDPTNPSVIRTVGYCAFEHLPFSISLEPNPRKPTPKSLKSSIAKDIRQTALEGRGLFHLVNAGIFILAESVEYNNNKGILAFELDPELGQGLYNGGHTLKLIEELVHNGFQQDGDPSLKQYCNFEIQVNVPAAHLSTIAEGRNSTVALHEKTLADYNDLFDWIKVALAGKPYADKIGYVENHEKPEDIEKVICRITAMNPIMFSKDAHPVVAYTSKKRCLELLCANPDKYTPLAPILGDILELYEQLIARAKENYLKLVPGGKFIQMEGGVTKLKRTTDVLPLTGQQVEYRMADGWLIPMLAAFRALVQIDNGEASWLVDPKEVYERIGGRLIRILYETSTLVGNNPNAVGKNENVYRQLYDAVDLELKSIILEKYKNKRP
ncbi:MAG: AIPR family protein [Candidatus Acidiferrales bacterium]